MLAFSLFKSSLLVIIEYALLNKEETAFLANCLVVRTVVKVLVSMRRLPIYQYRDLFYCSISIKCKKTLVFYYFLLPQLT